MEGIKKGYYQSIMNVTGMWSLMKYRDLQTISRKFISILLISLLNS